MKVLQFLCRDINADSLIVQYYVECMIGVDFLLVRNLYRRSDYNYYYTDFVIFLPILFNVLYWSGPRRSDASGNCTPPSLVPS